MTDPSPFRSLDFWIAVGVALIVKVKSSASLGPLKVITTIMVAVGAAWVGVLAGRPDTAAIAAVRAYWSSRFGIAVA